jgi:hypothetical protein
MGSYGHNFDFLVVPDEDDRGGRYYLNQANAVPIGAPLVVAANATPADLWTDALPATLATGAQAPKQGMAGIAVYEHIDFNGLDPEYYTYSDRDTVPVQRLVQLVSSPGVKVIFTNTADRTFLGTRQYKGRTMVAGMGATPTVKVGDYLSPGTGTDAAGYWASSTAANAWLVITNVDPARQTVEAKFNF